MRFLFLILILTFSSCQARDFNTEINNAYKKADINKMEKILNEYYQINGVNKTLEISYIKLALLKKDLKEILNIYRNTKYISIKKDKEILDKVSSLIVSKYKKLNKEQRIKYYKNALKAFPYSEKIYNNYLLDLLELNKTDDAFKVYLKYDEIFNKNNKYLTKIIFFKLKNLYKTHDKIKIIRLISKLENKEAISFLEDKIMKNPKFILNIYYLPKGFDLKIIKNMIANQNYALRKQAITLFINYSTDINTKEYVKQLYKNIKNDRLKLFIYYVYYQKFKEEIDEKIINRLLDSRIPQYMKAAIQVIKELKLEKYVGKIKLILGGAKEFKCGDSGDLLKILFDLDIKYAKNFIKKIRKVDPKNLEKVLKRKRVLSLLGEKVNCSICLDILKDTKDSNKSDFKKEYIKADALTIMLLNKKDISFFKEYGNIIYYNIFLKYSKYLSNKLLEKVALVGLRKWNDSRMMLRYLNRLTVKEIDNYFKEDKIKTIKNQYFMKIIYYSVVLTKTNEKNYEFEQFILKKKFLKLDYIDMYNFNKKQINILIKLYLIERKPRIKNKIIEKLIKILNK